MDKFYQSEWFDIPFDSFTEPDPLNIAGESFYDAFYKEFFRRFSSYKSLPIEWQNEKGKVVDLVNEFVNQDKRNILSIGCGLGYVEYSLSRKWTNEDIKLTAIEPSRIASQWLKEVISFDLITGYFPECLEQNKEFDFAYSSAVEYVLDDRKYLDFIESIRDYGIKDFLIISASFDYQKNSLILKNFVHSFLQSTGLIHLLYKMGLKKKTQFWGYLRTFDDHRAIFEKAGFNKITYGMYGQTVPWIRGQIIE